jgi:hypothetical protein
MSVPLAQLMIQANGSVKFGKTVRFPVEINDERAP